MRLLKLWFMFGDSIKEPLTYASWFFLNIFTITATTYTILLLAPELLMLAPLWMLCHVGIKFYKWCKEKELEDN